MRVSHAARVVPVLLAVGLGIVAPVSPALAHHKPGHNGGPGSNCDKDKPYPPAQCKRESASVNDNTVTPGQKITFYAQGFKGGTTVRLGMDSAARELGSVTSDDFDFATTRLVIPRDTEAGAHRIVATGTGVGSQPLTLTVPLTVERAGGGTTVVRSGTAGGGTGFVAGLPHTGLEIGLLAVGGAALLGFGAATVVAARRRTDSVV